MFICTLKTIYCCRTSINIRVSIKNVSLFSELYFALTIRYSDSCRGYRCRTGCCRDCRCRAGTCRVGRCHVGRCRVDRRRVGRCRVDCCSHGCDRCSVYT
ncbi:unnamed protein product [Adineta steineri]|uniref:Uncharacterized protein n=1 Tax=Adineta steineri TaxID=433720 RepID=A0A820BPP6_9BILA|nr:unnamed protein product [Adineta steineri]